MTTTRRADQIDIALITELARNPQGTAVAAAAATSLSRNTVRARMTRYDEDGTLESFERRVSTEFLGYPLSAYILTNVTQRKLARVAEELERIPEVLEVNGLSGISDLMIRVVAVDADDLYRIAGQILAIDGVKRTNTALVMQELISYRIGPLLERGTRREKARGGGRTSPVAGVATPAAGD